MSMMMRGLATRVALAAVIMTGAACDSILEVENPGPLDDEDLNTVANMTPLVTGMSFDLSRALDDVLQNSSIMGDDLYHGGSYGPQGLFNRGIIDKEDVNGMWGSMHRARWVAESGIERMRIVLDTLYDTNVLSVRANIYAGFANRLLGEHVCDAVIDGGGPQPHTVHFERADSQFTEALRIVPAVSPASVRDSLRRAAYGGRASVRAWLGRWAEAAADARQVPTTFTFWARYSTNTPAENNDLVFETNTRLEYTVFNTQWAQVFRDPRVPWDTVKTSGGAVQSGQDGRTPFFRQRKLNGLDADVPLTKGTEMLMLRAEERLRAGFVDSAMVLINQQRAFYNTTQNPLPALTATTAAEAWPILQKERAAVLWIEGRRFWDLRRWNAEPAPIKNTFLDSRDQCIPISENEEQSNPNV
jgi:starch-binding outer membrane protein, SusD/RagB family